MQKVVGSNPISRSLGSPLWSGLPSFPEALAVTAAIALEAFRKRSG